MQRHFVVRSPLLLLLFVSLALPLAAQQNRFAELERVVTAELEETKTPGALVAIVQGDRVVYAKGFGIANVETGQPMTPEMLFPIASMTKMYTAAALVSLAEEGKIDLNAPIGRYLGGLSPRLASVSAHQLLSHTAGLKDLGVPPGRLFDDAGVAELVRSYNDTLFFAEPGAIFSYANTGFNISGYLVERVAGKPYSQVVQERLLGPLGMARSTFQLPMVMTYPFSQMHAGETGKPAALLRPMALSPPWPAGGMFSNVDDLARFAVAFMNDGRIDGKQAIPAPIVKCLSIPRTPVRSQFEGGSYGYGLLMLERRGVRLVMHGGTFTGYTSAFAMAPDQRVAVIMFVNRRYNLTRTLDKALEIMLPLGPKPQPKPVALTPSEIDEYVGRYSQGQDPGLEVVRAEGGIALKTATALHPLTKIGTDLFTVQFPGFTDPIRLAFVRGTDGRVQYLHNRLRAIKRVP